VRVHLLLPEGVDDPRRPSGGNVYDRRLVAELTRLGWEVVEHPVTGDGLGEVLAALPDGELALVDGLVASTTPVLVAERGRLRTVVLLHMPGAGPHETEVLGAVDAVVTPSAWAAGQVPARRAVVAVPGVDPGPPAAASAGSGRLLAVGPATAAKGYDVLLAALDRLGDLDWECRWVGPVDAGAPRHGRVTLTGPLTPAELDGVRSATDLVVAPSRRESYGMAVAEGLARGIPVVASDVGGHQEAVGDAGLLVPTGDAVALADALRRWLTDPGLRARLRERAARRARELPGWDRPAATVAALLADVNRAAGDAVSPGSRQRAGG